MRHLILMRHAKTEKDSESGEDRDRRLDKRGRDDAAMIGTWLSENGALPDLALVSTAVRTRQTWDIMATHLPRCETNFLDELYLASALEIFRIVRKTPAKVPTLLIIGHNPGLHEIAWTLIGKASARDRHALAENLPTAAAVTIKFSVADWKGLSPQGGVLSKFVTPKHLKDDGER